jgi:Holliday junction resolvase RusA-like endonuclease
VIALSVAGVPAPEGSVRALMMPGKRFPVVVHDNPKALKEWRGIVQAAATGALDDGAEAYPEGPVTVRIIFYLPRPASITVKHRREPTVRPDVDKLTRAVLDALTKARVYTDDAQVCELRVKKQYALAEPGALIKIYRTTPPTEGAMDGATEEVGSRT